MSLYQHEVSAQTDKGVVAKTLTESNQLIAATLGVSVKTIEAHRESIKRKLGLHNAVRLSEAAMLWRRGEFEAPDSNQTPLRSVPLRRSA